jgi:hypothetical protein
MGWVIEGWVIERIIVAETPDERRTSLASGGGAALKRTSLCCSKPMLDMGRTSADGDDSTNDIGADKGAGAGWETSAKEPPGLGVAIAFAAITSAPGINVADTVPRSTATGNDEGSDATQEAPRSISHARLEVPILFESAPSMPACATAWDIGANGPRAVIFGVNATVASVVVSGSAGKLRWRITRDSTPVIDTDSSGRPAGTTAHAAASAWFIAGTSPPTPAVSDGPAVNPRITVAACGGRPACAESAVAIFETGIGHR